MAGKNLIVSRNPAKKRRTAAQTAASRRNLKKARAAKKKGGRRSSTKKAPAKRRNPTTRMPTLNSIINDQVMPAAIGGTGAVLNDIIVNMLPLPPQFKTGWMRHVSKAIGAVAIGILSGFMLQKKTANQLGAGAMTVVGYNVVRDLAAQFAPQIPLGEYLDMPLGEYLDPQLGYYGAGLNPATVPGAGLEVNGQFTRGSPYIDPGADLDAWPTGGAYEDLQY